MGVTRMHLAVAAASLIGLVACSGETTFELAVDGGDRHCTDAVEAVLGAVPDGIDGMVDRVPEAIRADVRRLVDAYGDVVSTWLSSGEGPADGALDTPELRAATDRVQRWLDAHCTDSTVD